MYSLVHDVDQPELYCHVPSPECLSHGPHKLGGVLVNVVNRLEIIILPLQERRIIQAKIIILELALLLLPDQTRLTTPSKHEVLPAPCLA